MEINTVIVVSTMFDKTLNEHLPDMNLILVKSIEELASLIAESPTRAKMCVITQDATKASPNKSFKDLIELVAEPYFRHEGIIFVSPEDSRDLSILEFLLDTEQLKNVEIIKGDLNKDFIINIILGEKSYLKRQQKFKTVMRMRKSDYTASKIKALNLSGEDVLSEEDILSDKVIDLDEDMIPLLEEGSYCTLKQITGVKGVGKTIFALILAQYLSSKGKTVLMEFDMEYFSMSDKLNLSGVDCDKIPLREFYEDPTEFLNKIKKSKKSLICLTADSHHDYNSNISPDHILFVVYSILKRYIKYLIVEKDINVMLSSIDTIVVMKNEVVSLLSTIKHLPAQLDKVKFVALNHSTIEVVSIRDGNVFECMLTELIKTKKEVPILQFNSIKLGGIPLDLLCYA